MLFNFLVVSLGIIIIIILNLKYKTTYVNNAYFKEHFSNPKENVTKVSPQNIYDRFYANVYDELFDSDMKNEFECMLLNKDFISKNEKKKIKILDIGCGTGQHMKILNRYGYNMTGLDISKYMIKSAKKKLKSKNINFKLGDYHNTKLFKRREFSHILCLFFTIAYCKNLELFFKNINYWLTPNGFIFIHVVNRDKFDPVLERSSSLIPFFDPQRYSNKRNTKTKLHFTNFTYESDWNFDDKVTVFSEDFQFKDEPYSRTNKHIFKFYKQKEIINMAVKNGFKLVKVIDEFTIGFNYNYILCLQKKYGK